MRSYYVDTSVIIARYDPEDELHVHSEGLFSFENADFYISPLSLLELYSVLSRVALEISPSPTSKELLLDTLVAFMVKDCRLKMVSKIYIARQDIAGWSLRLPLEYSLAMRYAGDLELRALDLLHLMCAWLLKRSHPVDAFITGDGEILDKAEIIDEVFKIKVLHPRHVKS